MNQTETRQSELQQSEVQRRLVGFVGLGAMGRPMSDHLMRAGFSVVGFDLSDDARAQHELSGGLIAENLGEVVQAAGVVVTSLPGARALMAVLEQFAAVAPRSPEPLVVIETSTLTLGEKKQAQAIASANGMVLVDCTVSGTSAQARNGDLVAYLSSDDEIATERAREVVSGFARVTFDVGAFGNGTKTKLVANTLVAIHTLAAAEALLLAERAGLDLELTLEAVGAGAGGSRMLQVRGPLMVEGDYLPATARIDILRKDISAIRDLAEQSGSPMPLLATTAEYYEAASAQGKGDHDAASLFAVLGDLPVTAQSTTAAQTGRADSPLDQRDDVRNES